MHAELQTSAVAACPMYYVHDVDFNNNNNNNYYYNYNNKVKPKKLPPTRRAWG